MRVPSYNEQMRYDTRQKGGRINGLQYSGQAAYENNARTGKAISGLGDTLMKASNTVFVTNMKLNEADATKVLTQYQKEFLAKQTEIQQLKGEQALHASEDFETWQQQRKQELTKDLNPISQGLFEQKAGVTFESNRQWVTNYQAREEETYMDGVYQAQMDTLSDTYLQNINDPKLMSESQQQAFGNIQEYCDRKGLGQEVAKNMWKNYMSGLAQKGVNTLIDNGELSKARTLLNYNKDYLSADEQAKMKNIIKREQEILNRKASEQREAQFKNQIASIVGENFDRFGENFTAQQFYQFAETIKDPAQREKAIRAFEAEMKYKRAAATADYNADLDSLNSDDFRNLPPQEREEKASSMIKNSWSNEQVDTFMKTARGVYASSTDPIAYSEVFKDIQNGNYENLEAFQNYMSNNMHLFTKEDANYLTNSVKGIENENTKLYNQAYATNEKILLPNKKKKEEEMDEGERQENMIARYAFSVAVRDKETELGRKMNADELNAFSIEYAKGYTYVRNKDGGVEKAELKQDKDYYEKNFGELMDDYGMFPADIERDRKLLEKNGIDPNNIENYKRLRTTKDILKEFEYMRIDDNIRKKHYDNKKTNNYALNGTLFERGNIDPTERPIVINKDGSIETVYSMTSEFDGIYYVIPTILRDSNGNGYRATPEEAVQEFLKTGKHMGAFIDQINANSYAIAYHEEQEKFYTKK